MLKTSLPIASFLFVSTVTLSALADGPGPALDATPSRASIPAELAVSVGSSMMLSPAVYSSARLIGTATPNLLTSALPALLFVAVAPPAIAAGMLSWERRREGAKTGFALPLLYAVGAQVLVLAGSFMAHTWVSDPKDLVLLSAATGLATGGAATLAAELHFR